MSLPRDASASVYFVPDATSASPVLPSSSSISHETREVPLLPYLPPPRFLTTCVSHDPYSRMLHPFSLSGDAKEPCPVPVLPPGYASIAPGWNQAKQNAGRDSYYEVPYPVPAGLPPGYTDMAKEWSQPQMDEGWGNSPNAQGYPNQQYPQQYQQPYQQQYPQQYQQQQSGFPVSVVAAQDVSRGSDRYRPGNQQVNTASVDTDSDTDAFGDSFQEKSVRHAFIRKVYFILTLQMLFTTAIICLFIFHAPTKAFVQRFWWLYILASGIYMAIYIALVCCGNLRRQVPINYILLCVLTCAMSFMAGVMSAQHSTYVVMYAAGMTTLVCALVTVVAMQTWFDITGCGAILCMASLALAAFGVVAMIVSVFMHLPILHVIYAALAVLLFSLYLMYDTQMIMGGKKIELSPEEYICGALQLYVDIVMIFMNLLTLFQECTGD